MNRTPEQKRIVADAILELKCLADAENKETAHRRADEIVANVLKMAGYSDVARRYIRACEGFWYG